jgi:hypothetical protein
MIITDRIPDVGIVKDRNAITGVGTWVVTCSLSGLTPEKARVLAAELLNAADEAERFTKDGR